MNTLRHHVLRRRWLAVWLIALTLFMKVLVPSGYMLGTSNGSITVELCSGYGPMKMTMPMPGMAHHSDKQDHGKTEQPCAFAGLNAPAMAGADALLLALVVAFIIATVFRMAVRPVPRQSSRLRPPLRGPPAFS